MSPLTRLAVALLRRVNLTGLEAADVVLALNLTPSDLYDTADEITYVADNRRGA